MDALKFAFEVLIVGALALPWLAVLIEIFSPSNLPADAKPIERFLSILPEHARDVVGLVVIVAVGYLLGSAVSRISRNLFNDELWGALPTEDQIRDQVYYDEYCKENLLAALHLPRFHIEEHPRLPEWLCAKTTENSLDRPATLITRLRGLFHPTNNRNPKFDPLVQEMFRLQEGELLLNGEDKVQRLKEYHDQIDILRGAALNGIILFALCLFGSLGNLGARFSGHRLAKLLTLFPACIMIGYGVYSLWSHWTGKGETRYSDPPLAELVLLMLGFAGLYATLKPKLGTAGFYIRTCAVAAILTLISYGGWWWTEVMYDLHVIHAVPELPRPSASAPSAPIQ